MIIVTFALPDESRNFVSRLTQARRLPVTASRSRPDINAATALALRLRHLGFAHLAPIFGKLYGKEVMVVHTGMGSGKPNLARLEHAISLKNYGLTRGQSFKEGLKQVKLLISSGFAGALHPQLKVGDVVFSENFSHPSLIGNVRKKISHEDHFITQSIDSYHFGDFATHSHVAETVNHKAALAASTGALAVDMETSWISEICKQNQLPMLGMRVISDAAHQKIPVPTGVLFNTSIQRPRYFRLPFYLLTHPQQMSPFFKFVKGIGPARQRLTETLMELIKSL